MIKFNSFSSENFGLSVVGHLTFAAIVVFLAGVVITERERFVAPDRIQITEIDLSQVRVSGDESILYNTNVPNEEKAPDQKVEPIKPKAEPVAETVTKLETPTLIQEDESKKKTKDTQVKEKPVDDKPAPKKKTIVRVNRNVVSLDRTLTVSVVDALRVAMTRCWTIDTKRSDVSGIRAVAHLTMRPNGMVGDVWFESAGRADTDPAFAYVLDTIRSAINVCQPFKMLPPNEYEKWRQIQLTFYPTQGTVM